MCSYARGCGVFFLILSSSCILLHPSASSSSFCCRSRSPFLHPHPHPHGSSWRMKRLQERRGNHTESLLFILSPRPFLQRFFHRITVCEIEKETNQSVEVRQSMEVKQSVEVRQSMEVKQSVEVRQSMEGTRE